MNYFLFIFKSALEDFARNKVRTMLTSLGILIGVASVVLLIALGLGFKKYIKNQFESLGTNLVVIMPGNILGDDGGFGTSSGTAMTGIRFDEKDVVSLKKVKLAEYVVPVFMKTMTFSGQGNSELGTLNATTADIFPLRNLEIEHGEYFNKTDVNKRSKKVVLGAKIAKKIFGSLENSVGKTIKIENQAFKVTGALKAKGGGGFGGPDFDSFVYMPYKSALAFNPNKEFFSINLKVKDENSIEPLKNQVGKILEKRYEEDDFSVIEQTEILNAVSSIFSVINAILVAIAAISLLVGGIGIMNIMYVSVIERVREIGIRRSIGAFEKDILFQFLTEAVILSMLGGLLGLGLSFAIVAIIQRFFPAYINITSVIIALGVSSAIGILFGVFPARKAAKLTPVEAIRYE